MIYVLEQVRMEGNRRKRRNQRKPENQRKRRKTEKQRNLENRRNLEECKNQICKNVDIIMFIICTCAVYLVSFQLKRKIFIKLL